MKQYIDKSAVVAEIERRIADNKKDIERASKKNLEDYFEGYEDALVLFKEKFLDTLEVKEVNLEEEIKRFTMSRDKVILIITWVCGMLTLIFFLISNLLK